MARKETTRNFSDIGQDGLRTQPTGSYMIFMSLHSRFALLSFIVCIILYLDTFFLSNYGTQNKLLTTIKNNYLPQPDWNTKMWTLEEITAYTEDFFLPNWIYNPVVGVNNTVGLPRIRLIYTKNNSCVYPVKGKPCYRGINFSKSTYEQVDQKKKWSRPSVKNIHCKGDSSAQSTEPQYTDDTELDDFESSSCFFCTYPRNGYVLDIPKPDLTKESIDEYYTKCVRNLMRTLTDYYVDESARFIQLEFLVYESASDLYALITIAFEGFETHRWWFSSKIQTICLQGLLNHGPYHGPGDDVKNFVIPVLLSLMSLAIACTTIHLVRKTNESYEQHILKIIICIISIILCVLRIYSSSLSVSEYEKLLKHSYENAPEGKNMEKATFQEHIDNLLSQPIHLKIDTLTRNVRFMSSINGCIISINIFLFFCYENYFVRLITLVIVSIYNAVRKSYMIIIYYVIINAIYAVIAHIMFGNCMTTLDTWTDAMFTLTDLEFGNLHYEEISKCDRFWGPVFYVVFTIICRIYVITFTVSYIFGMAVKIKRKKKKEMIQQEVDDELEEKSWREKKQNPVTLNKEDKKNLMWLHEMLRKE